MSDPILAAMQTDAIKSHIDPSFRAESPVFNDMAVAQLSGLLGVSSPDDADKDKMSFIRSQFDMEDAEALYQIRQIERTLHAPRMGERRLDMIYNYLRAKQTAERAVKERDSYLESV